MSNKHSRWKETCIWQCLEKNKDQINSYPYACTILESCMDNIERVLDSSETGSTDFTLHDGEHSFRVAERMVEIIPDSVFLKLSGYELALLLLSAYLHDIGMTPEKKRVTIYYSYLLTGEKTEDLSKEERTDFKIWLNRNHGVGLPLSSVNKLNGKTLGDAEFYLAHYCREKHNDWSAEWLRDNFKQLEFRGYKNWIADLIKLCQSHHFSHKVLLGSEFEPHFIDSEEVVHLRYLALVLRIADVLDLDPERTPEVVLRQRNVSPKSLIYWRKDQGVTISKQKKQYHLFASPKTALIHKAVKDTVYQIDEELRLCSTVALEKPLKNFPGSSIDLPHKWTILPSLQHTITPYNDRYEFIDGNFRPDTKKLLKLLAGIELYGDKLAAVRELIQNAADAVRERIARHRIEDSTSSSSHDLLSQLYSITLTLEQQDDTFWLVCDDLGAGMNKQIINNHLLVSGSSCRTDLLHLADSCKQAGFNLERTAKFGIGVLSYFMVADQITINTQRCQEAGDSETHGWTFSTEGLDSFGELRKVHGRKTAGTEVRLRLQREVATSPEAVQAYWTKIIDYLQKNLITLPCRFEAKCDLIPAQFIRFQPGWIRSIKEYSSPAFPSLAPIQIQERYSDGPSDMLPANKRTVRDSFQDASQKRDQAAKEVLHWKESKSGRIENDQGEYLGDYRFSIPYFELPGGNCFHYMDVTEEDDFFRLNSINEQEPLAFAPKCPVVMAWLGVHVGHDEDELHWPNSILLEVDWKSEQAGTIEANRNTIILSKSALDALHTIWETTVQNSYIKMVKEWTDSIYALYNHRLAGTNPPTSVQWYWYHWDAVEKIDRWKKIAFPVTAPLDEPPSKVVQKGYSYQGKPISRLSRFTAYTYTTGIRNYVINKTWYSNNMPPDRIVCILPDSQNHRQEPGCLWTNYPPTIQEPRLSFPEASFPPEWQELCMIARYNRIIWNKDHELIHSANSDAWNSVIKLLDKKADPRPVQEQLVNDRAFAVAWILLCLIGQRDSLWAGLVENESDLLKKIWQAAQISTDCIWVYIDDPGGSNSGLCSIDPTGWDSYRQFRHPEVYKNHMPVPNFKWCLQRQELLCSKK